VSALVALAAAPCADGRASRKDAEMMKQKSRRFNCTPIGAPSSAARTMVTQSELNSYLVYEVKEQLPIGVWTRR